VTSRPWRAVLSGLVVLTVALVLLRAADRPPTTPDSWLEAAGLEARRAELGGVRVRYVRHGRPGSPAVVLLHGFGSSIYTWKEVIPGLGREHDVVALDLPGFGGSEQPSGLSFELYPRVVLGLMDRLALDRAALVGSSMGGAVAALVAADHPERVARLALLDAAGFNFRGGDVPAIIRVIAGPASPLLAALPGKRLAVEIALRQVFHDDAKITPERVSAYLAPALRPGSAAALRSLGASWTRRPDAVIAVLPRIRAPALVVWGREDRWVPVEHASRFAAAIPEARTAIIEECGHLPQEERPEEVIALLLAFLGG
jgi:pimeloyl-ACP methyl ester carboxylesterase